MSDVYAGEWGPDDDGMKILIEKNPETVKEIGKQKRIVIIFMTDGCDSCNRPNAIVDAQVKLRMFLKNFRASRSGMERSQRTQSGCSSISSLNAFAQEVIPVTL